MKKNKFLRIFCAVFLSAVLLLGVVLGVVLGVAGSRTVMSYEGHRITSGVYSYFASTYKTSYIASLRGSGVSVTDTSDFWESKNESGVSYGEAFEVSLREYVASILGANAVYASYARYTREDKNAVRSSAEAVLRDRAGGSEKEFNRACEAYGFDYDDFLRATELLYKANKLYGIVYGQDGSGIAGDTLYCNEYFEENYTRVKLLVIRTRNEIRKNEQGDAALDEDGNVIYDAFSSAIAERQRDAVASYKAAIDALESGVGGKMNAEMFEYGLETYDGTLSKFRDTGHYFRTGEGYTDEFPEEEVVRTALALSMNDYAYFPFYSTDGSGEKIEEGYCFLWRVPLEPSAYTNITYDAMFESFYKGAADSFFGELLSGCLENAKITKKMTDIDPASIPYNTFYKVVLGGAGES